MRILGLSSATKIISFGLLDGDQVVLETTIADPRAERLLFYAQEAGIRPEQIEGVAVAVGPGSYSGLRGGVAAAKTLAQTLNVALTGVSTLEAIAYNLVDLEGTIAVILDARLDEYNFALFGASNGKLNRLTDDLVIKVDRLMGGMVDRWLGEISTGKIWIAGNLEGLRGQKRRMKENVIFADEIHAHPYGINVAKLGALKISRGEIADPLKLVPNYSHQPNIKEFRGNIGR